MKKLMIVGILLLLSLSGCGDYKSTPIIEITMPNDTYYYETEDWTVENVIKEFESMGFTKIVTERMGTSSNYVYGPIDTVRIAGKWTGWSEGDIYYSNDEVKIRYYDPTPTLTTENCPELSAILKGESSDWFQFATAHDGEFIEFDGCVIRRTDSKILNEAIITVCGGDYSESINKQPIRLTYISIDPDIKRHALYGSVGSNYKIIGQVDLDDSEYYNTLTIETMLLEDRE